MVNMTVFSAKFHNVTSAINETAAQPVFANISWKGFIILLALIITLGVVTLIAFLSRGRKTKTPAFRAFFLTGLIAMFMLMAEGLGWFGPEGTPGWIKTALIILLFISLLIIFSNQESDSDEKITKLFPARIPMIVSDLYNVNLNIGEMKTPPISDHIVLANDGRYGRKDTDVVHYLATTNDNILVHLVFGLDSDALLKIEYDVRATTIEEIFHKLPKPSQEYVPPPAPKPAPQPPQNAQTA